MNIKRFKENIANLMLTSIGDDVFSSLRILTNGMTGIRVAKLINFACNSMNRGEFYLEVGTYTGYTLVSAGYQNNSLVVGIDDFSIKDIGRYPVDEVRRRLRNNIKEYGNQNSQFIESNVKDLSLLEHVKGKLAVLFIDGTHDYDSVKENLEKFKDILSEDAVIIFDDIQIRNISKYIYELCSSGEFEMLFHIVSTMDEQEEKVHMGMNLNCLVSNGISVLARKGI